MLHNNIYKRIPLYGNIMRSYIVTIKNNSVKYTSREEINEVLKMVKRKLKSCEWSDRQAYELDSLQRWHYHTIMTCCKEPYFKAVSHRGWHIHFRLIDSDDHQKVIDYLTKVSQHKIQQDQLDWYSYAKYNYLFQNTE